MGNYAVRGERALVLDPKVSETNPPGPGPGPNLSPSLSPHYGYARHGYTYTVSWQARHSARYWRVATSRLSILFAFSFAAFTCSSVVS